MLDIRELFLTSFGFDGYDPFDETATCADHPEPIKVNKAEISLWLLLAAFFGLPSRPAAVLVGSGYIPVLTLNQLIKNFVGGWLPFYQEEYCAMDVDFNERAIWQVFALPLKLLVIFPLKILLMPFKALVNIAVLLTGFVLLKLSTLVLIAVRTSIQYLIALATVLSSAMLSLILLLIDVLLMRIIFKMLVGALMGIAMILIILLSFIGSGIYLGVNIISIGFILSLAPEFTARTAFKFGLTFFGRVSGILLATMSISITAIMWAIALPLLVSTLLSIFPSVLPMLAMAVHLPVFGAIYGFLWLVGQAVGVVFAPVTLVLSTAFGVSLTPAILTLGSAAGILLAPLAAILSRVADDLSNWWAIRHDGGPITWLNCYVVDNAKETAATNVDPHHPLAQLESQELKPGKEARSAVSHQLCALDDSTKVVDSTKGTAAAVSMPYSVAILNNNPVISSDPSNKHFDMNLPMI